MFSGLKKIAKNLRGSYEIFKNASDFAYLVKNSGCTSRPYEDADPGHVFTGRFYRALREGSIADRYSALVKGLDPQSIAEVADIINGVMKVGAGRGPSFLTEGLKAREDLRRNFFDRIVKLSEDLYVWGDYILPGFFFDPACLYYKCGLDFLDDPSALADRPVIDAGAYVGDSALIFSRYTRGKIHCFEPVSFHCRLIEKTIKLNRLSNISVQAAALGQCEGEITISGENRNGASAGASIAATAASGDDKNGRLFSEKVRQLSLDDFAEAEGLSDLGLIKMDIEGAEKGALLGAREVIAKYRPTLIISIYHGPDDFFDLKPLIEQWALGYKFKIRRCPYYLLADTVLIAEAVA